MSENVEQKANGDLWVTDAQGRKATLHWSRFHGLIASVHEGGAVYLGQPEVLAWLAEHLGRSAPAVEGWEYAPGHRWVDHEGNDQWFVQSGRIKPSYVARFIAEGGEVIRRKVGPWEVVAGSTRTPDHTVSAEGQR